MSLNGGAVISTGVGSLLVWSGIKGWSVLATLGDVVAGKTPQQAGTFEALFDPNAVGSGGIASGSGSDLAGIGLSYVGHCYVYGGAPGKSGMNCWDCSSFVNWVTAVKARLRIPGYGVGAYDGSVHGPPTGSWAIWPGLRRIPRSQVQRNDIIIWAGHMGIATGPNSMVSALNPGLATKETSIDGNGNGPLLKCGRYG